jgi:YD repeat-containing protein
MKINRLLLLTGICASLLCPFSVFSQVTYNKQGGGKIGEKPEPGNLMNASSLDGMDYATGTLKVGIPIYEIKVNDISVPISINYSALGLKANQKAGPVGMGWELSAGGKITTVVNGLPDNDIKGIANNPGNPMMNLPDNGNLDVQNNIGDRTFALQSLNGATDAAWDLYSYSIPNAAGKFMEARSNFLTFPYDPLLSKDARGLSHGDGIYYLFLPGDKKLVSKRTFRTKQPVPAYTTDWTSDYNAYTCTQDLAEISSSRYKDKVTFEYERFTGQFTPFTETTSTISVPLVRDVRWNPINGGSWVADQSYTIKEPSVTQTSVTITEATRIKFINFKGGRIVFDYDQDYQGQDVLLSITVQQKSGVLYKQLKKFLFDYSKNYGHYLTAITVYDEGTNPLYSWAFDYYGQMPNLSTFFSTAENTAQDRWGFYNGKTSNQTLIESPNNILALRTKNHYVVRSAGSPSSYGNMPCTSAECKIAFPSNQINTINFADREFVFSEAIKGTLKSVKMPTGGYVEYEYEPHKFLLNAPSGGTTTETGGGIRVKSIVKTNSAHQVLLKKEYKYGLTGASENDELSKLESGVGQVTFPANVLTTKAIYSTNSDPYNFTVQNLSVLSHAGNDMSYPGGSYGIYRNVTEYLVKAESGSATEKYSGKTIYFFNLTNEDNLHDNFGSSPNALNLSAPVNTGAQEDLLVGKPEKTVVLRINPSGNDPVKRTYFSYNKFYAPEPSLQQDSYSYFGGIEGVKVNNYINSSFQFVISVYNQETHHNELETITMDQAPSNVDPLFFANIEYEDTNNYFPGKYSGGVQKMYKFSSNWKTSSVKEEDFGDSQPLQTKITTIDYNYNSYLLPYDIVTNENGDTKKQKIKYPVDYSTLLFGIPELKAAKMYGAPIQQLATKVIDGSEKIIGGVMNEYVSHDGLINESKINQFNTGGKPVAYSTIDPLKDSKFELRKTFEKYDVNGNILQFSETAGPKTAVIYGYDQTYAIAQVQNAQLSDVAYSGFESGDQGNWTYNNSGVIQNSSITGKYAYSLSGGTISKSGLDNTKNYIISYWRKDDASATLSGGTLGTLAVKRTLPGWKLIEQSVSATTAINLSGNGLIDDVRLYPIGALMTSCTYEPLIGLSSSTDPDGKTIYYEYDSFQRLRQIKDQQGEIVKRVEYNYLH